MLGPSRLTRLNAPRNVKPEAFNVAPELVGMPLARPWARMWAILLDLLVIAMLSSVSGLLLLTCAGLLVAYLIKRAPHQRVSRTLILAALTIGLAIGGAQQLWDATGPNHATKVSEPDEDDEDAPAANAKMTDAERIADLTKKLEEAQKPHTFKPIDEAKKFIRKQGVSFGWAALYFSVLPFWLGGQTLGKKLFGLRVVELTGKKLKVLHYLSRYGGYAAGMATGMFGFAQVLWDPNRQAIQDKISHTVVVDLRAKRDIPPTLPPESEPRLADEKAANPPLASV